MSGRAGSGSSTSGAIVQWTPVEQFQAEPDRENAQTHFDRKGATPKDNSFKRQSTLRSAGSIIMDFSSLPSTLEPPAMDGDEKASKKVQCNKFLKEEPERWQIVAQHQKHVDDANVQGLSALKYLEKFSDKRWLSFDDPLLEKEFLKDWWDPTHACLQIILVLTSTGLVIITLMDIMGENHDIWQIRACCRWSTVLFGVAFMARSARITSLFKRRNQLFFVVLYYFVVLVLTDEERLVKFLTKFGQAYHRGLVGRLAEATRDLDIQQRSERTMLCRSIVPFLLPQLWFAMTFLRMSSRRSLALVTYVGSIYLISSVFLHTEIWKTTEGTIMELFCFVWGSATALYTTRKNEVLTRFYFLKHVFRATASRKDFGMNGNALLQSSSMHYWQKFSAGSVASRQSNSSPENVEHAQGFPWNLLMPHERDTLLSSIDCHTYKFSDQEAEDAFMLYLWEDAHKWISWTGWLMSLVFILLVFLDWSQEGFSFTLLRLVVRIPLLMSSALYHFLENNLALIRSKQLLLLVNITAFFICMSLHNAEAIMKMLGKPDYTVKCDGGTLMLLTCQICWVVKAVCLPWKLVVVLLFVAFTGYLVTGVGFGLTPFDNPTSSIVEVFTAIQMVVLLTIVALHGEMLARKHFQWLHHKEKNSDEEKTWPQHMVTSMPLPMVFSKALPQKPYSHFSINNVGPEHASKP